MLVRIKAARGFTLIELLVALLITVSVVLGFSVSTLSAMRANRFSERYARAASLGQEKLAFLRANVEAGSVDAPGSEERGIFRISWSFPPVTSAPMGTNLTELLGISVVVSWQPPSGAVPLTFDTIVDTGGS